MSYKQLIARRKFVTSITALGALATALPHTLYAADRKRNEEGNHFTFLFQGDSITDGNRSRNADWNHVIGHGYQYIIASKLWYDFPQKDFHFFNRGISGNTLVDLTARWQQDTLDLQPDLLSILIGINDTADFINGNNHFTSDQFEINYRSLLQQTKQRLPRIQLVLCEPFVLPVGKVKDQWNDYAAEVAKRGEIVRKLGDEYDAVTINFQDAFNKALSKAPADYWIWDGIHPMPAGHELMAVEWLRQVGKKVRFIR